MGVIFPTCPFCGKTVYSLSKIPAIEIRGVDENGNDYTTRKRLHPKCYDLLDQVGAAVENMDELVYSEIVDPLEELPNGTV